MSGHTPGPWFAVIKEDGHFQIEDGKAATSAVLCTRFSWAEKSGEMAANARLIAAAPDLLEALQAMLEQFTKTPSTYKDSNARRKAHAAISKATGGAP